MGNLEDASISLLLPYCLDGVFAEILREDGFEVFWANNRKDTERIIKDNEPHLPIEWRNVGMMESKSEGVSYEC